MAVKQNAIDHCLKYPKAAKVVHESCYVDDCLTGAEDSKSALALQQQLVKLFSLGGFSLRKWNSNDPAVLQQIPSDLRDSREVQVFSETDAYSKTLGIEWNTVTDRFRVSVSKTSPITSPTKRSITSDVAKVFDVLGFLSPTTIKMKILLQRLWELKLEWDDPVPQAVKDAWSQWREELNSLTTLPIPRCYKPKNTPVSSIQLHGFSDASEEAYAGVVYLRLETPNGSAHTALVMSKTKVLPIKRLSIPRLVLCGANILAKLLCHVRNVLDIPITSVFAWTDSTIVLSWLSGNPRRFKTYVGNRISNILNQLSPESWRHVPGVQNPADCASRGLFLLELKDHHLWWHGPKWLQLEPSNWPTQSSYSETVPIEEKATLEVSCSHGTVDESPEPIIPLDQYSNLTRLKRVTAWIYRFCKNTRSSTKIRYPYLSVLELNAAEIYWLQRIQNECFPNEMRSLKNGASLPRNSKLVSIQALSILGQGHPFNSCWWKTSKF